LVQAVEAAAQEQITVVQETIHHLVHCWSAVMVDSVLLVILLLVQEDLEPTLLAVDIQVVQV
jgi:hypothetical protein